MARPSPVPPSESNCRPAEIAESLLWLGLVKSSWSCFFLLPAVGISFPWVTRFSSRSARWPPHDGVRRARRPNLFHDLRGLRPLAPDSQRDRLAHRPHGDDTFRGRGLFYILVYLLRLQRWWSPLWLDWPTVRGRSRSQLCLSTSGVEWLRVCGRPQRGLAPFRDVWRSSCPMPVRLTIFCSEPIANGPLRREPYALAHRHIGWPALEYPFRQIGNAAGSNPNERRYPSTFWTVPAGRSSLGTRVLWSGLHLARSSVVGRPARPGLWWAPVWSAL